jgi:hypothetical protein
MAQSAQEAAQKKHCAALAAIASIMPRLGEAELKAIIALANAFAESPGRSGRSSSRDITAATGMSRPNIQAALDSLQFHKLIRIIPGTGPKPSEFHLDFLGAAEATGFAAEPLTKKVVEKLALSRSQYELTGFAAEPASGFAAEPAEPASGFAAEPVADKEHAPARASIDSIKNRSIDRLTKPDRSTETTGQKIFEELIDRALNAQPKFFDRRAIEETRRAVYGYQMKFGAHDKNNPPPPPDDKIISQMLATTSVARIQNLIDGFMCEKPNPPTPGEKPAWWVSTILQRVHGVAPETLNKRRKEHRLQIERDRGRSLTGEQQPLIEDQNPDPQFASGLVGEVLQKRKGKGL